MADENNVNNETATKEDDPWAAAMDEQNKADAAQAKESSVSGLQKERAQNEDPLKAKKVEQTIFKDFTAGDIKSNTANDIDFILDIPVQLTVELGRTKIAIKNLLQLAQGSVVELDGLAGEPMDVLVNGCLIAQGEVVVVNDKFGIRLTDIITPAERIRKLNR